MEDSGPMTSRNKVHAVVCVILLLCTLPAVAADKCNVTEKNLAGAWAQVSNGFFEEMEFTTEGGARVFNSWLHERPEIGGGTWSLENCVLKIAKPGDPALSFEYQAAIVRGRLSLMEKGEPASWYKRIKN
jgi:hypothetical protein